ncbi:MAG TPA: hypothetical protein V6C86_19435 [Oculatellaceae cyanobacterium]
MTNKKRLLAVALSGAFGLGLVATSVLATPLAGPVTVPAPVNASVPVTKAPVHSQLLKTYRQIRTFWLSRAIVR